MEQALPAEEMAKQRLQVLVSAYTLFVSNLKEQGVDLERVKAASDRTWAALGTEAGRQLRELFADAPVREAVFASGSIASAVHGMEVREEQDQNQKHVTVQACPWHDAAEALNMPREWRLCKSGHEAFTTAMLKGISPDVAFEMSKALPHGDTACEEIVTV